MRYDLVEGAIDLHVHSSPDVLPRKMNDLELARRFKTAGMAGYCLKSHYFCTSERADLVNMVYPGFRAMGGIVLNSTVGGINPAAVELAAISGAKIIWLPTCDSAYEQEHIFGENADIARKLPFWAKIVINLKEQNIHCPTITLTKDGQLRSEVEDVMRIAGKNNMVLATAHISHEETFAVAKAVKKTGVEKLLITHVTFPTTFYTIEEQKKLVSYGAYMEHCATTHILGKVDFDVVLSQIRAIGPERIVISTDLGQSANPYPDEGLIDFAERLHRSGFSTSDIRMMIADNPNKLTQ